MTSVAVIASDHVGSSMAGTGIRYLRFARELARAGHDVTLVTPFPTDIAGEPFAVLVDNPWHAGRMTALARSHEVVVAQQLPVPTLLALADSPTRVVLDLYAPLAIEQAALLRHQQTPQIASYDLNLLTLQIGLQTADVFLCAGERQRDLWLGALLAHGRLDPVAYREDPSARSLVRVVPFGVDPDPVPTAPRVLKGVVPGIALDDRVALWGGGIWNWLDPITVIEAVHRLGREDLKLFFLGTHSPNPAVPEMATHARARARADELGLTGRRVFFNDGWVPYEKRAAYLVEADVGVSAHFDELEARFAFRTRLLDYLWAGLPVVATRGDAVGELLAARGVATLVDVGDVDAYASALAGALAGGRDSISAAAAGLRRELAWPQVVLPLLEAIATPAPEASRRRGNGLRARSRYALLRGSNAVRTRGWRGLAGRAAAGVARRARGDHAAHPLQTPRRGGEGNRLP